MNSPEINARLGALLQTLLTQTDSGTLKWSRSADEKFEASLRRTSYAVSTLDGDSRPPFLFTGYDGQGEEMMRIDTNQADGDIGDMILRLYESVRDLVVNRDVISFLDIALDDVREDEPPF